MPQTAPDWVFDPTPPSGALSGGDPASYVFNPSLDSLVREVVQNATDQQIGEDPVSVTFTLHELSGEPLRDFLAAISWDRVKEHYDGVAKSPSLINGRVKDAVAAIDGPGGRLRLLTIQDSGTHGLTGPEDGTEGNFVALCKHILVTTPKKAAGGGSYGLGKAVLWRFSALSTVVFGSTFLDPTSGLDQRVFGRAELPYHDADGQTWSGSGWFGVNEELAGGTRARSIRAGDAARLLPRLHLGQESIEQTGTTALVFAFSEPGEVERDSVDIAKEILEASSKWFWPRLMNETLTLTARCVVDGVTIFDGAAEALPDDLFVMAASAPATGEFAKAAGDVAEQEIVIRVPGLKDDEIAEVEGKVTVRLIRTSDADKGTDPDTLNCVALTRGAGMVVQYRRPRQSALIAGGFRAVLLAGTAHGITDEDDAIEEFLRAAEPPAHDQWVNTTNKLASRYRAGAGVRLRELFSKVDATVVNMCDVAPAPGDVGPALLERHFRVGGSVGSTGAKHKFEVRFAQPAFDGTIWHVEGRAKRTKGTGPWAVDVAASLEGIGGFKAPMIVKSIICTGADVSAHRMKDGTVVRYMVPDEADHFTFELSAEPSPEDGALAQEARLRVDASPFERNRT